ncbi:TIR domain-containing protein [Streptomyces sp. NBC_01275]|uniref:TIR domain-containing protein n=1 Tax=Streptomyces sp. NBC_01275 TaxID=2903807 RepID=UPI002258279B|nr:TIR domain-containing protein [Streptomyces sp. NBC_01275]MCX4768008.1 TIR domain-containing protein [Streptomyces sp. NBC_01275]
MPDDEHGDEHDNERDEEFGTAHDGRDGPRRAARPGVFLAYAPADADRAAALDGRLRADGARTALDESRDQDDGLPAEPVLQELGACDLFLLLWSRDAADDPHVQEQYRYAASFGKPCLVWPLDTTAPPPGQGRVEQLPPGSDDQEAGAAVHRLLGAPPADPRSGDGSGRAPATVGAVESGHWRIESDAQHGESLEVELAPSADAAVPDDSVEGGHLTGTHRRAGMQGRVTGRWWFSRTEGLLDLELESSFGLRPVRELRRLQLLGGDDRSLTAEDLHGIADPRHYRLTLERPC